MKFITWAASAALALVAMIGPASAEISRTTVQTSVGPFVHCTEHARFAPCGTESDAPFGWRQAGYVIGWQYHTIRTPTGNTVMFSRFRDIAELNGDILVSENGTRLWKYDAIAGDFKVVHTSVNWISVPTAQAPGPYLRLDSEGGRSLFRGLLQKQMDGNWKEIAYNGDDRGIPDRIESMQDGRLKLTPYERSAPQNAPIYFDPKSNTFSNN